MSGHRSDLYAAPVLLVIVACIQLYRAHAFHQSPWKGGGFGMFASRDSPGARFLRCYLITPDGEYPVKPPRSSARMIRLVHVVPTRENLARVAKVLAGSTWVPFDYHRGFLDDGAEIPPTWSDPPDAADSPPRGPENPSRAFSPRARGPRTKGEPSEPLFRVKSGQEPDPEPQEDVDFSAVRAELWRSSFDAETRTVRAEKWREVILSRVSK